MPRRAVIIVILVLILPGHVPAASRLSCTLVKRTESAYWYKEGVWTGLDPHFGKRMPSGTLFREYLPTVSDHSHVPIGYLFAQLDKPMLLSNNSMWMVQRVSNYLGEFLTERVTQS